MSQLAVFAAPSKGDNVLASAGAIAFIKVSDGRDAIFIRDAQGENAIYTSAAENVIILTPSVSQDGAYITFVEDNGKNQKVVHLLGPLQKKGGTWMADDMELMSMRGGAWPVVKGAGEVYISMPDPTSLVMEKTSNIYLVSEEGVQQITDSDSTASNIWPLLHPDGSAMAYRSIPQPDDMGEINEPIATTILDLETGETSRHFVGQFVFMDQWTPAGDILYSFRDKDENGNRVYSLYSPETGASRVIHRSRSRQGSLSQDSDYLATIKLYPKGGAQYDIFVLDLDTGVEINLTETKDQSESLIGWVKASK